MIDEGCFTLSLRELSEHGGVSADYIIDLIDQGILEPLVTQKRDEFLFQTNAVLRLQKALRLQQDLDVNLPGTAVVLDLLDQIDRLNNQVLTLQQRIETML